MCLDTVLCLKYRRRVGRDNTVKYRWRTLQLLPDKSRPSYAGSVVEVLEGLGPGSATRRAYRASQQAPPAQCPAQLRHADRAHGWSQPLHQRCHQEVGGRGGVNGHNARSGQTPRRCRPQRRRKSSQDCDPRSRKPTPLQTARWKAVQKAKRKGLSIRGIARELSIHRDTVRKYMNAESPPMSPARATSAVP